MRIGISCYWFNRGQGVVGRQLRSGLDELGHETFVLARPTRETNIRAAFIDRRGVWDQPGITEASAFEIPGPELERWADENRLEVAFFDQNYQFAEIARLREAGVRTVGRFVWEHFSQEHVDPATDAFDVVYSMTACERERYADLGIESPRVPWGCHPELLAVADQLERERPLSEARAATFFFPGGFMSKRKPLAATLRAIKRVRRDDVRFLFKTQVDRRVKRVAKFARDDPRIEIIAQDLPSEEHLRLFASCDVCLAPSRWEGLGLHLFEATAFGMPIVTNDNPPMNEVVAEGVNGLLVPGIPSEKVPRSGIPSFEPDEERLVEAIQTIADPEVRAPLASGARRMRARLSWDHTVEALRTLLAELSPADRSARGPRRPAAPRP